MWDKFVGFFVWQPVHIWTIAAVFGVLFLAARVAKSRYPQINCWPLLVASLVWLAYGYWERAALINRWDIRVDLLLGWPILFGGTAIAIVLFARSVVRAIEKSGSGAKT